MIGVQHAGVHDAGNTGRLRGGNHIRVLREPLTCRTARHQQQPVHADKRGPQGVRSGVVR